MTVATAATLSTGRASSGAGRCSLRGLKEREAARWKPSLGVLCGARTWEQINSSLIQVSCSVPRWYYREGNNFRGAPPPANIQVSNQERIMPKKNSSGNHGVLNAEPRIHQRGPEIQPYGTVTHAIHLQLEEPVRLEMTEQLNQQLADSMSLRDLYKKAHWQVAGPTFYQLHLLFDKNFEEQVEVVDTIAERIQLLGGLAIAMAADVAETTRIERPPRGREEVPVVVSRLVDAHQVIIQQCREIAERSSK